jgi:cellobiose dehydrogenase (acceptor)
MIDEKYWIELPVGYNLDDNPNASISKSYCSGALTFPQAFVAVSDPNLEIYDYVGAYNTPIAADAAQYLGSSNSNLQAPNPKLHFLVVSQLTLPLPFFLYLHDCH